MKRILTLALAIILVFGFTACVPAEAKDFTCEEMTITLTDAFTEANYEGFNICYETFNDAVFVFDEDFETYPQLETMTIEEYADAFLDANENLESPEIVKLDNGIYSVEYSYHDTEEQVTYKYLATFHKSAKAFWVVQFACKASRYTTQKAEFEKWAGSVKFAA